MAAVLSPIEQLGLAGAALEARVRRATQHVADSSFVRIAERLNASAFDSQMIYEHEGRREAIRVMLRPLLAMRDQLSYVHYVCQQLTDVLKRMPGLYLKDPQIRRLLAIDPKEEHWLRETWTPAHERHNSIYGRFDAVCDFAAAGWQASLQFMEANLSSVGGIHFGPVAEQLVMHHIVPTLVAHDPELSIELPRDQRDLFVQLLIDHARTLGRDACRLCFVEPKYSGDGPDEQSVLSRYLSERHGLTIVHADPSELRVENGEVYYEDVCVDLAYRDYESRDLVALEEELGRSLDAMRLLFRENRVVSSLVGDFDHKSCWEILTDPQIAERLFSVEECRLFRRHVLWTRIVGDRRTSLPHNVEGDLLDYARRHRELLVLKPNRACGGEGVALGAATEQGAWEKLLDEAAQRYEDPQLSWVLQSATRLPVSEFPVVGADGRVFSEPFYVVMGFAPTEHGLGTMCRVSQKQVVNVAQHGGLAAVLVSDTPPFLRMPNRSLERSETAEKSLAQQITDLQHLEQTIALLEWDEETMLPAGAHAQRGEQLATLEGMRHSLLVSDRLADLIEEVASANEGGERTRELFLLRRQRRHALALSPDLVRRFAHARSAALGAWEEARQQNQYSVFAPAFSQLLELLRERAEALAGTHEPYDALLDEYEPAMSRARLEPVLLELRDRLVPLLAHAAQRPVPENTLAARRFASEKQWNLARYLLGAIGLDFRRGRLDRSTHPFTTLAGLDDIRLTIRAREDDLCSVVLTTLHEGGHALYDQGFAQADRLTLLADAPSMGLHECQARLWENHVGRSPAFWRFLFPTIRDMFPEAVAGLDSTAFAQAVNVVRPGAIRVDADEISYHLHILLRYELECALIAGTLSVAELPAAWDEMSVALLGIAPKSDREGVLQDSHWALGMFGYFPSYTIGSLYAAQLVETYAREHPLEDEIARGEFAGLLSWLREHIHSQGRRLAAEDLIRHVTGTGLDAGAFVRHLEAKFGPAD